jgi:hypothetical protein
LNKLEREVVDLLAKTPPRTGPNGGRGSRRLSPEQLAFVLDQIQVLPGSYTLPEMLEDGWGLVRRKTAFGVWFRASVLAGQIPWIRWLFKRSDKRNIYEVLPRP